MTCGVGLLQTGQSAAVRGCRAVATSSRDGTWQTCLDPDEAAQRLESLSERLAGAVEDARKPRRALLRPRVLPLCQWRGMHLPKCIKH